MSLLLREESAISSDGRIRDIVHIRSETAMQEIEKAYTMGSILGQGSFGVVCIAKSNGNDGIEYACKTVKKKIGSISTYEQQVSLCSKRYSSNQTKRTSV